MRDSLPHTPYSLLCCHPMKHRVLDHAAFLQVLEYDALEQFDGDARVRDFVIACSHLESLHSHDAVSVINKGMPGGLSADFSNFRDLIC